MEGTASEAVLAIQASHTRRPRMLMPLIASMTIGLAGTADLTLEFDEGAAGWRTVVDGVMGGLSSGRVTSSAPGVLAFSGDLSLENNGGFSQIRRPVDGEDFAGADGIELRVRGDGRSYNFDLRAANARVMAGSYQTAFETINGTWITIRLPFEAFTLTSFGREVRQAPELEPTKIESLGLTLSDKVEGAFLLEIDSIRTYSTSAAETVQTALPTSTNDEALRLITLAISRGVPLFNEGQHAACASVYEVTIESLLALARAELDGSVVDRLEQGLRDGANETTWVDRAWAYRRAFDDVAALLQRASDGADHSASL